MPTFEASILAPPSGFVAGCRALNKKFETKIGFGETILSGINIVKTRFTSSLDYSKNKAQTLNTYGVVTYLASSWLSSTPKPSAKEVATFLDLNSVLSRDVIKAFVTTYTEVSRADQLVSVPSSVQLAKIEKLAWKVGVALTSSKCADSNSPYVRISLQLQEPGSYLLFRKVELSYDDFLRLAATFKEVYTKVDEL